MISDHRHNLLLVLVDRQVLLIVADLSQLLKLLLLAEVQIVEKDAPELPHSFSSQLPVHLVVHQAPPFDEVLRILAEQAQVDAIAVVIVLWDVQRL